MNEEKFQIRTLSLKELAVLYDVSTKTMRERLKEIGVWKKYRKMYFPSEVKIIFEKLGIPKKKEERYRIRKKHVK